MNRIRGFTLVELMITVAIAAIVLAVGVPSFQDMMRNNRSAAHANEMLTGLNFARSEAAKRGENVSICASSNQASCGGTDWAAGWIVFFVNSDGDDEPIRVWEALSGNPTFTGPATLSYRPTGALTAVGMQQFSYQLGPRNHLVCVNPVGRPSIEKDATSCP